MARARVVLVISEEAIDLALRDLFDLSPVPLSISTIDHDSRYIKVNPAYLGLTGRSWGEIENQSLGMDLPYSINDPARLARLNLLETRGFYEMAEVEMLHVSGRIISTLITAQRRRVGGECFDIEIVNDNTERKALEQSVLSNARTDAMTGLQNKASFEQFLTKSMSGLGSDLHLSLAYIDLNQFKPINDRHGHRVGDRLLKAIAVRMIEWANPGDFVARIGGDEFAVVSLFPSSQKLSRGRFFELAAQIAQPIVVDGNLLQVGAAIGVAEAALNESVESLIDRADKLMYAAKSSGDFIDVRSTADAHRADQLKLANARHGLVAAR